MENRRESDRFGKRLLTLALYFNTAMFTAVVVTMCNPNYQALERDYKDLEKGYEHKCDEVRVLQEQLALDEPVKIITSGSQRKFDFNQDSWLSQREINVAYEAQYGEPRK
ncbi:MAG: hypothetical protein ABIB47_03365 [Candidatus Woesearchaeota archaeon]